MGTNIRSDYIKKFFQDVDSNRILRNRRGLRVFVVTARAANPLTTTGRMLGAAV